MRTIRSGFSFALPALGLSALFAVTLAAQVGAPFSSQMNALGGRYGAVGMGRPLGGIGAGGGYRRGPGGGSRSGSSIGVYPYGFSYYVPGYFDALGFDSYATPSSVGVYDSSTAPAIAPPPMEPVVVPQTAPAPTVIINQYFSGAPSGAAAAAAPQGAAQPEETPRASGEPLGPVDNYYLIAYKDHSVYAALSYWLEGNTFHYVTTHNIHNQASLDLIDLNLTKTLNQARDVPFTLPGH